MQCTIIKQSAIEIIDYVLAICGILYSENLTVWGEFFVVFSLFFANFD